MGVFRFKRFSVVNELSAMKVNTDGVLLGALMSICHQDRNLLDVGTGTGTIALMAAQRLSDLRLSLQSSDIDSVHIDAIDIDQPSAAEAAINFSSSEWSDSLHAHNLSLDQFRKIADRDYDLIFSNPPYFEDSLQAPQQRRNLARHTDGLSYRELLDFSAERLSAHGRFAVVLPSEQENTLTRHARMNGLFLQRIVRVRTVPHKAPQRIIAEFSRSRCVSPAEELLTIQKEGKYTQEYLSLTKDFYLFC